jgi:sigma-B regulation protein RsbU (phosphoserine phosphatase)
MSPKVERLERKVELQDYKLGALLEVTRAINARASEEDLLEHFRRTLAEYLGIDRLVLYTSISGEWRCMLTTGVDGALPPVAASTTFEEGKRVTLNSTAGEEVFDVVVPVKQDQEVLAYVLAGDTKEGVGVSPVVKHLNFITTLTNVLVVALHNRRLLEAAIRQEATRRELELAAEMQALLVPTEWPEDPDVEVSAYYRPHREVGGDYFDLFPVEGDRLMFCMADVSGKGVSAAFLMSNFQANLRAILQTESEDLERSIRMLNERVMSNARGEKYITLFVARYDRKSRELTYINCGHNPPLLMGPDGTAQQLVNGSVGLGMFAEIPSVDLGELTISRDSVLVCYTDGLVEQENGEGVPFGMQRMERLVRERRGMEVATIQTALLEAMENFRGAEPTFDDTALMLARFR